MRTIFLDIETTGLDPAKHRPIDIGLKVVDVTSGCYLETYQSIVKVDPDRWDLRDPTSMEVNGFTWDQIITGREIATLKADIIDMFTSLRIERGNAVFVCQNPGFDRGFFNQIVDVYTQERLNWPYHWLDLASMFWACFIQKYQKENLQVPTTMSLSKNEIAKCYGISPELKPHRALKGVEHLIQCYEAVLNVKFK